MTRRCVGCGREAVAVLFFRQLGGVCARCAAGRIQPPEEPHRAWVARLERMYHRTRARRGQGAEDADRWPSPGAHR